MRRVTVRSDRPTTSLSEVRALTMLRATTSSPTARSQFSRAAAVKFLRAIRSPRVDASRTSPFNRRLVASVAPARKNAGTLDASRTPAVHSGGTGKQHAVTSTEVAPITFNVGDAG